MNTCKLFLFGLVATGISLFSCTPSGKQVAESAKVSVTAWTPGNNQLMYWKALQELCGNAFEGSIEAGGENDTVFGGKRLLMHVRSCEENRIRIPFFVGSDSSRTWVLTLDESGIHLKHDHRHSDGTPDEVTMYGGKTTNTGSGNRQFFPADQETVVMLPEAAGNIWWIDVVPGEYFTYNLRRVNTPRLFSVRFDLSRTVEAPGKPWGWQD